MTTFPNDAIPPHRGIGSACSVSGVPIHMENSGVGASPQRFEDPTIAGKFRRTITAMFRALYKGTMVLYDFSGFQLGNVLLLSLVHEPVPKACRRCIGGCAVDECFPNPSFAWWTLRGTA